MENSGAQTGLTPAISQRTRLLILGSFPGRTSLHQESYYAHPRNRFWPVMEQLLGESLIQLGATDRLAALDRRRVGLWDVVASADRKGSLDADLRPLSHSGVPDLLRCYPAVDALAFNGSAAWAHAKSWRGNVDRPMIRLPSTSPMRGRPVAELMNQWRQIQPWITLDASDLR